MAKVEQRHVEAVRAALQETRPREPECYPEHLAQAIADAEERGRMQVLEAFRKHLKAEGLVES